MQLFWGVESAPIFRFRYLYGFMYVCVIYIIYIIQFHCLFVRSQFGQKLLHRAPPNSVGFKVGFQKCPPRKEISFNFQFSFATDGHFINYRFLDFQLLGRLIRCCQRSNLNSAVVIAATLYC